MNYIVFDLEWNQPEDKRKKVLEPVCLNGEIVEIGAVKLDDRFSPLDELRLYVKPIYYPRLSREIVILTKLRDKLLVQQGLSFPEAWKSFLDWCGEDFAFMTWSMADTAILMENMLIHGLDVSAFPVWYDVQRIFCREIMRTNGQCSLEDALKIMSEQGDKAHDALHDARNTVKICNHLDLDQYLCEYTSKIFGEPNNGKRYSNKRAVQEDISLREFVCPWCGQPVTCEPWLTSSNGPITYGLCPEGDEFYVQLIAQYLGTGEYSARRVIFEMSDDLWDIYMNKKEAALALQNQ